MRCDNPNVVPQETDAYLCANCESFSRAFRRVESAYLFDESMGDAIHALKYAGNRRIATSLAEAAADQLTSHVLSLVTILCPVPLHVSREQQRGYNQSTLLTDSLAELWQRPILPQSALARVRETPSQTTLGVEERRDNVQNAFIAQPRHVKGQIILVIDDVCTTGATIDSCAQALLAAGAAEVYGFTIARA